MPDMLKLAAIAVTAALCAVVVRKSAAELAAGDALATGGILVGGVLSPL